MESLIKQFLKSSQLSGGNAAFIEELYEDFLVDPASVPAQWKTYFESLQGGGDVPDPYTGDAAGFESVWQLVDAAAAAVVARHRRGAPAVRA